MLFMMLPMMTIEDLYDKQQSMLMIYVGPQRTFLASINKHAYQ